MLALYRALRGIAIAVRASTAAAAMRSSQAAAENNIYHGGMARRWRIFALPRQHRQTSRRRRGVIINMAHQPAMAKSRYGEPDDIGMASWRRASLVSG